ncbi:MAG: flagellar hook-basal body protein [Synergistaceae bacterium]|nr:flagellar hook-basal body protein [Synergistaceae bacterium]
MVRGLYTNGWSMLAHNRKMDVIANNLANINTNGYKKETACLEAFPELMIRRIYDVHSRLNPTGRVGPAELSADLSQNFIFFNPGPSEWTEKTLDIAIDDYEGEDNASRARSFFTVEYLNEQTGETEVRYTRDGAFVLSPEGTLMTVDGNAVMGEGGRITLAGDEFVVTMDGQILQNDVLVDRLVITSFEDPHTLRKTGDNLYYATEQSVEREFDGVLRQFYLEHSNVNPVTEMVDMITVMRAYEANQKMIHAIDGTLEKACNEVGRV